MKRLLCMSALLALLLSFAAMAQGDADEQKADLEKATKGLFAAAAEKDTAALTAAVAPDAQILMSYMGHRYLSREDFVTFATSEDLSTLAITDLDCNVVAGIGFSYGKMNLPGFVDGFFYAVATLSDGNWVVSLLVVDPTAGYLSEDSVAKAKAVLKTFGDEAGAAVANGSLQPIKDRIDPEHAVLLVGLGQLTMPPSIGRDAILGFLGMVEMQMANMGGSVPLLPTGDEDAPYPNATYVGNGLLVVWGAPTVTMGPAQEAPVRSVILATVKDDKLSIIGIAVGVDMNMGAM